MYVTSVQRYIEQNSNKLYKAELMNNYGTAIELITGMNFIFVDFIDV